MEIDSGSGPGIFEPPTSGGYAQNWTGLVGRTFELWFRKLLSYVVLVGVISLILSLGQTILLYSFFGAEAEYLSSYIGVDIFSFALGIWSISIDPFVNPASIPSFIMISLAWSLVAMIVNAIIAGAAIKFCLDDYTGQSPQIGSSFSYAGGRAIKLILANFVVGLIMMAIMAIPIVLLVSTLALGTIEAIFSAIIVSITVFPLFLIFVLYIAVRLAPVVPIIIAEDLDVIESIKKAYRLTAGLFWHVLAGQFLLGIAIFAIGIVVGMIIIPFAIFGGLLGVLIPLLITGLFFGALGYIFSAVLYQDLISRTGEAPRGDLW